MTKKTIYLHIGFEKTGTTSIQNYCFFNAHELSNMGICYPNEVFVKSNHIELATCFCEASNVGFLRKPKSISRFLQELKHFIQKNNDKDIIFSNEHLSSRIFEEDNIKSLKTLLSSASHRVVVICYVRDPAAWLVSRYSEGVKSGFSGTLDQCAIMSKPVMPFESLSRDLANCLHVWRNVFGDDLYVHEFEKASQIGLVKHFFDFVSSGELSSSVAINKNYSLSYEQIWLLSFVNKLFGFSSFGRVIRKPLVYFFNRVSFGRPLLKVIAIPDSVIDYASEQRAKLAAMRLL